jgi:uncharacterized protein (TIGR02118 family)
MLRPEMSLCLFVSSASADAPAILEKLSRARIGERCVVHTPASARDPFLHDGAAPSLVLQAYFADLASLGAGIPVLERILGPHAQCEAMAVTRFPVAEPGPGGCSYLVAYAGPAEDPAAWHAHYNARHAPLMAELPGIRELEVYAPVEWRPPARAWQTVRSLQRNKVAFDCPQALEAALQSPVRAKMRADFATFPRYRGEVTHYPMLSFQPWPTN